MATKDDIETLFKSHYTRMHQLASMLLHDHEAAHDIVHDVFASLLDKGYSGVPDLSYLMASVRNRCLNRLKALDIRERFRQLYLIETDETDNISEWPDEETLALIEKCEKRLSSKCLEVFNLRFHEGLSSPEIANRMNVGERVIYKHLRQALTILKQTLNGQS